MKNKITYNELEARIKELEHEKKIEIIANNQKFLKLVNSSPLGVSTNSLDGYFISVNKEFCNITGYSEDELLKLRFLDITLDEYHEMNINIINELIEEKIEKAKIIKKYRKKDGTPIDVIIHAALLKDENNKPQYLLGILEDISERVERTKQLNDSKSKHKKLFTEAPIPILLINHETDVIENINPAAEKFTGYTKDEIINRPLHTILPEDKQETEKLLNIVRDSKNRIFRISTKKIITKNKKEKFVDVSFFYLFDDKELIQIIANDVTESKENEAKLYIQKKRLELSIEASGAGLWDWDIKTGNIVINDRWAEILGYTKEEILPSLKDRKKIIHPKDFDRVMSILNSHIKGEKSTYKIEYRLKTKSGDWKWILDIGKVIEKSYNGKALRALGLHIDISSQKEKEKELILAKEKAQESDKLKSAFLANMSHEIRTPMNAIIGFLGLMKNTENKEKKEYYTTIINQNAESLLNIINDIVDVSKIEAKQIDIYKNDIDPNYLLNNLYTSFKNKQININNNKCIIKTFPNKDYSFSSDEDKIRRILTNLISNAMKFTANGTIEIGYRILPEKKAKIQFYVKDNGIGIDEKNQKIIFEHFRQAELELTRKYGGAGIGLSISKGFAEILGGKISFDSEINKGSIFYFTLPYNGNVNTIKNSNMIKKDDTKFDYSKLTILVAEDEFFNYEFINEILLMYDIKVLHAQNGLDAIELVKSNSDIDLILMDIKMPELNGLDATKRIKEINSKIPIIAQTAYALSGDKEKIMEAGCDNYIAKPINKDDLMDMINIYI